MLLLLQLQHVVQLVTRDQACNLQAARTEEVPAAQFEVHSSRENKELFASSSIGVACARHTRLNLRIFPNEKLKAGGSSPAKDYFQRFMLAR